MQNRTHKEFDENDYTISSTSIISEFQTYTINIGMMLADAAACGNLSGVEKAISAGAHVNICNNNGVTPLLIASQNGHEDVVNALINHHANANTSEHKEGMTPLIFACINKHYGVAHKLLVAKANPNQGTISVGQTPLHTVIAAKLHSPSYPSLRFATLLLSFKANPNQTLLGSNANSLHLASALPDENIVLVRLLLNHHTSVNVVSVDGTPLAIAALNGRLEIAKELLKAGADVNLAIDGKTPLHCACMSNNTEIVRLLLANGANKNAVSSKTNQTPLDIARHHNNRSIIELIDGPQEPTSDLRRPTLPRPPVPARQFSPNYAKQNEVMNPDLSDSIGSTTKIMDEHMATEYRKNSQMGDAALARFAGLIPGTSKTTNDKTTKDSENLPSPRTRK